MKKLLYLLLFLSFGATAQPAAMFHSMLRTTTPIPSIYQPETDRYFDSLTANSVSWTTANKLNVDTVVRDIKGLANPSYTTYNIKDSFYTLNPVFGATAYSHSLDLLDATLPKWTFFGSPTHSAANGISFNGTTQYANTNFSIDQSTFPLNNRGSSIYHKNLLSSPTNYYMFGAFSSVVWGQSVNNVQYFVTGFNTISTSPATSVGRFTSINRYSSSDAKLYTNNTFVVTETAAPTNINLTDYVGAINASGAALHYQYDCLFFAHHKALPAAMEAFLYQVVQAYQTRLSRQVP